MLWIKLSFIIIGPTGERIVLSQTFQVEQNPEDAVELKENQIYYDGKQVTFTDDHKLKPTLFDGHKLVYLSDKDRGIGFYTLRVIDLNKIYRFNPPHETTENERAV